MRESNAINRENVEVVQRALVFFDGQVAAIKRTTDKRNTALTLVMPWQNTGVTPAMNGKARVNWLVIPQALPDNFAFPDLGNVKPRQFDIPPRAFGNGTADVPIEFIEKAKNKGFRMYVWGWITYDDMFKGTTKHLNEFCDEIVNIKSDPDDITDPKANITWESSLCGEHNCTDERCADYSTKIY